MSGPPFRYDIHAMRCNVPAVATTLSGAGDRASLTASVEGSASVVGPTASPPLPHPMAARATPAPASCGKKARRNRRMGCLELWNRIHDLLGPSVPLGLSSVLLRTPRPV